MASELTSKQALLYTTLDDLNSKDADLSSKLKDAQQRAAAAVAAKAAQAATTASSNVTAPTTANNDSALASNVVSLAYSLLGVPYVSGGSSPSGFDCPAGCKCKYSYWYGCCKQKNNIIYKQ